MRYQLDPIRFKAKLQELGYSSTVQFGEKHHIHRNTIRQLLDGKSVFLSSVDTIAEALKTDPLQLIMPVSEVPTSIADYHEIAPLVGRLVSHDEKMAIFLLGSRAKQRARRYSDWDIAITRYPDPISGREYLRLKEKVSEWSEDFPRMVDLINLDQAPLWFLNEVGQPIFLDGDEGSHIHFKGVLDGIEKRKVA